MDNSEPKQLKLAVKKEKEPKANKWILLAILLLTVVASLIAYWTAGIKAQKSVPRGIFGQPKIIEF